MTSANKCSCGGELQKATLRSIDLQPLFGVRGSLTGPIPGRRCASCAAETFAGTTFERMRVVLARTVLGQDTLLAPAEARFLRQAILGLTQDKLAKRLAINKTTIADWERGERPISKEHDYELRGISLAALLETSPDLGAFAKGILTAPRTALPPKRPKRHVIPASELRAA